MGKLKYIKSIAYLCLCNIIMLVMLYYKCVDLNYDFEITISMYVLRCYYASLLSFSLYSTFFQAFILLFCDPHSSYHAIMYWTMKRHNGTETVFPQPYSYYPQCNECLTITHFIFITAHHIFPVAIAENEQAVKCGLAGYYELYVNKLDMSLYDTNKAELLYSWPYRHIRRYGRTPKNFQFEAGRKCASGKNPWVHKQIL